MATIKTQKPTEETSAQHAPRPARRLTLEEAKRIVTKNSVMAAILAPHDGPVTRSKGASKR